jgi:predicted nuclease of predicted toxin-antitoxin system
MGICGMKFIFDECVSYCIARALKALGKDADSYSDHWERGCSDIEWIPVACAKGYCVITSDQLKRPHEREALKDHRARVVLIQGGLRFWDQVKLLVNRWEDIERHTSRRKPPYILKFTSRAREPQELRV